MAEEEAEEGEESEEDARIISSSLELTRRSNSSSLKIIHRSLDLQITSNHLHPLNSGYPLLHNNRFHTTRTSTLRTHTPLAQETWATLHLKSWQDVHYHLSPHPTLSTARGPPSARHVT